MVRLCLNVGVVEAYQDTFELTVDLHARSAVVEETGVVVIPISVDAIELWLRYAFLRVLGRQLDPRLRFITRLRARFDGLNIVLRDEGSLAIFYRRAIRRGGLAILIQGHLLLPAVLRLGTAFVLAGECRIVRAGGIRHLSIVSPKATELSPNNARLMSSVMRLVSVIKSHYYYLSQQSIILPIYVFKNVEFSKLYSRIDIQKDYKTHNKFFFRC